MNVRYSVYYTQKNRPFQQMMRQNNHTTKNSPESRFIQGNHSISRHMGCFQAIPYVIMIAAAKHTIP